MNLTEKTWKFYGRREQLAHLKQVFSRGRWFFMKITGRRRIGKTALVNEAIRQLHFSKPVLYVQIPDSGETGVISSFNDAMDTFSVPSDFFPRPKSFSDLTRTVEALARAGYIMVLDEFQYFNRKPLGEFCSLLQATVDKLSGEAASISGGLIVSGSIHTEMTALLEDRHAPLYNRVTDSLELTHLDIASVLEILRDHADNSPDRLLFMWTLFEGVPKFYRDCFEQGGLASGRRELLRKLFFESSSPLRSEAESWFLHEVRGRYDAVLKFVARNPGRSHKDILEAMRQASGDNAAQIGSYLKTLSERYRLIERHMPVFSKPEARKGRYYLADNFLQAWLGALSGPVSAREFRPKEELLAEADKNMEIMEGLAFERLVGRLYEERSRLGIGDFPLSRRIQGYWDRSGTEIDLVVVDDKSKKIRFGSCKRAVSKLLPDIPNFKSHVARFLDACPEYGKGDWEIEMAGFAPQIHAEHRAVLKRFGIIPQDLRDLTSGLLADSGKQV